MRILYVAFGNNPAVETILGGMHDETLSGLPAFYYPFKMLLARGCTIDLLLYSSEPKTVVESAHFRRENLIQIRPRHRGALGTLELPLHLAHATRQCLRARHYDFVYGMTEGSHMAVRTAAHMGIPCALRQFGTQEMANVLETIPSGWRRQLRALKDYTYITLSMRSRKNFLLQRMTAAAPMRSMTFWALTERSSHFTSGARQSTSRRSSRSWIWTRREAIRRCFSRCACRTSAASPTSSGRIAVCASLASCTAAAIRFTCIWSAKRAARPCTGRVWTRRRNTALRTMCT